MNVLQVNFLEATGGAARISYDLFRGYRERGHGSYLAVGRKQSADPDVFEIPNEPMRNRWSGFWRSGERRLTEGGIRLLPGLARLLARLGEPRRWREELAGVEDCHFPGTARLLDLPSRRPDLLHLHVLHGGYFDLRLLPELSAALPTVVTLHDEWLMTGHCACTLGCERWRTGCGACPDLASYPPVKRDATAYNWQRKRMLYRDSRLYLATPSRWLMDRVYRSMLRPALAEARVIPNGVDLSVFSPGDRGAARREVGVDEGAWVALFVGHGVVKNRFKDFDTLLNAVSSLPGGTGGRRPLLICLGEEGETRVAGGAEIRFVGYQGDPHRVARFYRAADVYLHAAHADTFPTTVLEALACGTPVIATAVGGIPEQIDEGESGFLVPPGDPGAMAERIRQLQGNPALRCRMGEYAAAAARRRFSLTRMVDDYIDWYQMIHLRRYGGDLPSASVASG
ncbi:glycosyltransferase [Geomesophilobacter sediminis]|uniref:Glycosyltransferase n=1 Tax=Geomesophilobacter sediminis TaxID=2798584 RepID=A0A8J7JDR4_9BACT|nr:glycosyltransferase [Geomesophilobacter sediminis]MBJ6725363.1 glycosyltransferase [Geomesophilobacter sediminis]